MAFNQRNSELVGMLSADFVQKRLPVTIGGQRNGAIMVLEFEVSDDDPHAITAGDAAGGSLQQPTLLIYSAIVAGVDFGEGYVTGGVLLVGDSAVIFDDGVTELTLRIDVTSRAVEVERTAGSEELRGQLRLEWLHNISVSNVTAPPPFDIFDDAEGDPASVSTAPADGTSVYAARRDHVHDLEDDVVVTDKIADEAVTDAKLRDSAGLSVIGRSADTGGAPADIVAASDAQVLRRAGTAVGFGEVATAGIANDAVTNAKLANMATKTYKGRTSSGTGDPEDVAAATLATDLVEVGTWTPVYADAISGGNTGTVGGANAGFYAKIGPIVHAWWDSVNISTAGMTGANTLRIRGLPFASANLTDYAPVGEATVGSITFTNYVSAALPANSDVMALLNNRSNQALVNLTVGALTSGSARVRGYICYRTA